MYNRIEYEFKKRSWYKRDAIFIVLFYICYIVITILFMVLLESIWYGYALIPLLFFAQYYYFFATLCKEDRSRTISFWKIKQNFACYIKTREQNDIHLLVEVCKENKINTRPKVLEALRHYQILVPRNIIGTGVFLSLVALIISIIAFSLNENDVLSTQRFQLMFSVFLLVAVLYLLFKCTTNQLMAVFGSKAFYKRMENLLSTIYFQSLIK